MINNVVLVGRAVRDPEIKTSTSGVNMAFMTLAVERPFKNSEGKYDADFIRCIAWDKAANVMAEYVKKGQLVGFSGRLQIRNYEDSEGIKRIAVEVIGTVNLLPNGKKREEPPLPEEPPYYSRGQETVIPDFGDDEEPPF